MLPCSEIPRDDPGVGQRLLVDEEVEPGGRVVNGRGAEAWMAHRATLQAVPVAEDDREGGVARRNANRLGTMSHMSLLEVIALHAADAERAEAGGADRVELLGTMDEDGLSPEPRVVEKVRRATSIQIRPMVRLRGGFGTDGGEVVRLKGLIGSYLEAGADGVVLGFLNGANRVDLEVVGELVGDGPFPWTFHRAIDHCLDLDHAWADVKGLPGVTHVLTAGSARGVEQGLDGLIARARADTTAARMIMAGGGLAPEHVPWLVRSGVRAFHIGSPARPGRSFKAYVDSELVASWRDLIDDEVAHARHPD